MPSILIIISQIEMERMKTRYLYVYPKILYNIWSSDWRVNGYCVLLLKAHKEHFQRSVKHVQAVLIINENGHDGSEGPEKHRHIKD